MSLHLRTWSGRFTLDETRTFLSTNSILVEFFGYYLLVNFPFTFVYRNKYATFKEIRTRTITVAGSRGDSKKAKLFITLQRGPDFTENMRRFSEIKLENEKLAAKNAENNAASEEVAATDK